MPRWSPPFAIAALAGAAIVVAGCGGGEMPSFDGASEKGPLSAPAPVPLVAGAYRLKEQLQDHCLVPAPGPVAAGTLVTHAACSESGGPLFDVVNVAGAVSVNLRHAASGLCIMVKDAGKVAGTPVVLAPCSTATSQRFEARPKPSGAGVQLVASHSRECLEARGTAGAAAISQQRCNSKFTRRGQLFELVANAPAPARWQPALTDTWQWQLTGTINTGYAVQVYDIDLFDTPQATINTLKANGRRVVCYFSAGSSENWRTDFARFQAADMGNPLDGWAGERWLDTRSANVREIMKSRLDLAASRGCDGVEPDNMDGYTNTPGFALNATTQLDFNRFIAREARARGLAVGLKNAVDLLAQLEPDYDFAVNEQCHQYNECGGYSAFTSKGKPVFNAEYATKYVNNAAERNKLCAASNAMKLRTLVLPESLDDSLRYSCD